MIFSLTSERFSKDIKVIWLVLWEECEELRQELVEIIPHVVHVVGVAIARRETET